MANPTRPCSAVHPRQQRGLRTLSAMALTVTSLLAARPVASSQQALAAVGQQGHPAGAAAATYGQLPLSFEPNVGQADPRVRFLAFWQAHQGTVVLGPPISEPLREQNGDGTGRLYLVQYCRIGRLEYHPELAGTPYVVTLGLLGREYLHRQGLL